MAENPFHNGGTVPAQYATPEQVMATMKEFDRERWNQLVEEINRDGFDPDYMREIVQIVVRNTKNRINR